MFHEFRIHFHQHRCEKLGNVLNGSVRGLQPGYHLTYYSASAAAASTRVSLNFRDNAHVRASPSENQRSQMARCLVVALVLTQARLHPQNELAVICAPQRSFTANFRVLHPIRLLSATVCFHCFFLV